MQNHLDTFIQKSKQLETALTHANRKGKTPVTKLTREEVSILAKEMVILTTKLRDSIGLSMEEWHQLSVRLFFKQGN
jgi:hypothetical protein